MLGVRCDVDIFKLTARAKSINREVYAYTTTWLQYKFREWLYTCSLCTHLILHVYLRNMQLRKYDNSTITSYRREEMIYWH